MRLLKIFPLVDFKLCNLCRVIHVLHRANEKSVTLDCLIDVEGCKGYNTVTWERRYVEKFLLN